MGSYRNTNAVAVTSACLYLRLAHCYIFVEMTALPVALSLRFCRQALQPLIEAGYLAFAYGGSQQGKFLCHHPLIDRVHLTGSEKTYDAIVWNGKPKVAVMSFGRA